MRLDTRRFRFSRSGFAAFACLALALPAPPAIACDVSATPLNFGAMNPLDGAATDSVGEITVTCPASTAYSIAIDGGGSGDASARRMSSGAQALHYQLYTDPSRSVVWGDGTAGTLEVAGQADGTGTSHQVHGRIPAQPAATPGMYADSLLVTITY
jgi:spore coat protein U-like protein